MLITDAHEHARVYALKDRYSNKFNDHDRQEAQVYKYATDRSEAKIDANAAAIISRITRASRNVHGKSKGSRKRRVEMAQQIKEQKKKRTNV